MGRLYVDLTGLLRIVNWSGAKFLVKTASNKCIRNTSPEQKKIDFSATQGYFYAFYNITYEQCIMPHKCFSHTFY